MTLIGSAAARTAVQEHDNLRPCAGPFRAEQAAADAARNAVLFGPLDCFGIECTRLDIGEDNLAFNRRTACRTIEERDALRTRTRQIRCLLYTSPSPRD